MRVSSPPRHGHSRRRRSVAPAFLVIAFGLCGPAPGWAQEDRTSSDSEERTESSAHQVKRSTTVSDDDLRIRGVFNSVLPGTETKHALKLIFHPHIGDLINEDYLRIPLGIRYGLSRNLELNGTFEGYFSHGLGDVGAFKEAGIDEIHLGAKYRLGDRLIRDWDLAVGLDWNRPYGTPPKSLTDGMEHISPFVSFARPLSADREWRLFGSVSYDDVTQLDIPRHLEKNQLTDDSLEFTVGVLHQRPGITYTFETGVATTRFTSDAQDDVFFVRPGLVWVMPDRYTFWARGRWLIGASVRAGYGPDGLELGLGAKLRISLDLKRILRRQPPPLDP